MFCNGVFVCKGGKMGKATISQKEQKKLHAKSGNRCAMPDCTNVLIDTNGIIIGENAHIYGENPESARYDATKEEKFVNSEKNMIFICRNCHKKIDTDIITYTLDRLFDIKAKHEEFVRTVTSTGKTKGTIIVKYTTNLHGRKVCLPDFTDAIIGDKFIENAIDLSMNWEGNQQDDKNFWEVELANLDKKFNKDLLPIIENTSKNLSVFAFGSIPLLVKLGYLLSNKSNIDVYQKSKSPDTWKWDNNKSSMRFNLQKAIGNKKDDVVLILSLSGKVSKDNIVKTISLDNKTVYEISIDEPYDDFLRTKEQLNDFMSVYRKVKEEILNTHPKSKIHLFAAIPVCVAVEIGRSWNANFDLPIITYDFHNGEYTQAEIIGGQK
jgi:hypothetical protein